MSLFHLSAWRSVGLALALVVNVAGAPGPVFNQSPLAPAPFANLPLGSVKAEGWLLRQLEQQRDGLTGQAETVIPELGPDNGWRGGRGEGWEKGPYYLKGLVALAYTLDDAALKSRAQVWLDAIFASRQPDGFYGPGEREKVDWWPRMVVDWALRDYYEATGDPRVLEHLSQYYRYMAAHLARRPLFDWGKARAADELDTVFWLYNRTGDAALLEVAAQLRRQAWDWVDIYARNRFQYSGTFLTFHNVNVPQAFKFPVMSFELSGAAGDREALTAGWRHLMRDNGLCFGMTSGTEFLCGDSPTQGTEMCSFVEQMLSFYTAARVFGDVEWLDGAERIAFNGMPAGLTKDFKQYQYYTYPNQVVAKPGRQFVNQDYEDGITPGPHSGCHCCCYNLHMGWPKFAQHAWMASSDGGLAAMLYAPSALKTTVAGVEVAIVETTAYPFEETIRLAIQTARPVAFPLRLRAPGWCDKPEVRVNGAARDGARAGEFYVVNRVWKNGDRVTLRLPMRVRLKSGALNTVSVERGPLVYALKIGERFTPLNAEPHGFPDLQCEPQTPWNYALMVDRAAPEASFKVAQGKMPANPFDPAGVPIRLTAKARRLPAWTLAPRGLMAFDPPVSPVASTEPLEKVTLVPLGSTTLRVASFPWLGRPGPPLTSFQADFSDGTLSGWMLYGGNCSVRDGQLRLGPDNDYLKAVVPGLVLGDGTVEADVTVGAQGNGGLMLRAANVAVGADVYQGYYVGIDAAGKRVIAGKADGRSWRELATAPAPVEPGKIARLKVMAQGGHFTVFIGADEVCEFTDGDYAAGTIGVREYGAKEFAADNVSAR
jgi:hypothetical protein